MKKTFSLILAAGLTASLAVVSLAGAQNTGGTQKAPSQSAKPEAKAEIGKPAPNFTLKTLDGKDWSLSDAAGKIVVLQWVNSDCPVCRRVMTDGTVADQIAAFGSDVVFVAVNSTAADAENPGKTAKYFADNKANIPGLVDGDGKVGRMFGAATTPQVFVIDSKGVLRYSGAIDDGNPGTKGKLNYAVTAVNQIKKGETVSPDTTKPYGCSVKYAKK
jgi:peroxiredoxin